MVKKEERKEKTVMGAGLEGLAFISQLGMTLVIPIVLGAVIGHWIDGKLDTGIIFFLILLCFGIAGGIVGAYRLILFLTKRKDR